MRQQKNAVHEEIVDARLDPADFVWDEITQHNIVMPKLTYTPTGSFFVFGGDENGNGRSQWTPGSGEPSGQAYASGWADRLGHVTGWLQNIRREYLEPDKWEE